ncbi:MAG TPA: nitrogen fixation protein NifQ [Malonomonas sp.]
MNGYTDIIRKYAADGSRAGVLANADGIGEVGLGATEVGRRLAVRFAIRLQQNRVSNVRFQVFGCGFTIAACAAAAELAEGQSLEAIGSYTPETINQLLAGLPAERSYCAELANQALQSAVASARNGATPVQSGIQPAAEADHQPRVTAENPLYQRLMSSKAPAGIASEDRQLFAGLLTVATQEAAALTSALGLHAEAIDSLLAEFFPAVTQADLKLNLPDNPSAVQETNEDLLKILLAHVPCDATGGMHQTSAWLARIIAARAAQPGHLWVAMGFFERQQLTAAIRRHLPTLAAANQQGMRWKRYLFKQLCDLNGGSMCKAPNCGVCSDYALCFAPED